MQAANLNIPDEAVVVSVSDWTERQKGSKISVVYYYFFLDIGLFKTKNWKALSKALFCNLGVQLDHCGSCRQSACAELLRSAIPIKYSTDIWYIERLPYLQFDSVALASLPPPCKLTRPFIYRHCLATVALAIVLLPQDRIQGAATVWLWHLSILTNWGHYIP